MELFSRLLLTKKPIRAAFAGERGKKKRGPSVLSAVEAAKSLSLPRLFHAPIAGGRAWNDAQDDFARSAAAKALFRFISPLPHVAPAKGRGSSRERV